MQMGGWSRERERGPQAADMSTRFRLEMGHSQQLESDAHASGSKGGQVGGEG